MKLKVMLAILSTLLVQEIRSFSLGEANSDDFGGGGGGGARAGVLSRKKRFLTFPDGSSLQLVFCCQTAALLAFGDIFLYSNTAALAWNLPKDPDFLRMFKGEKYTPNSQRRADERHIYYLGSKGEVLAKVPYRRHMIVNPAFAKRSVDLHIEEKQIINKTEMHAKQANRDYLNPNNVDDSRTAYHRSSRADLFQKLEVLFETLGQKNGRHCVLKQLCEAKKDRPQGSFLDEIQRAVFTLPKGQYSQGALSEYDAAHSAAAAAASCGRLYPECDDMHIH